MAETTPRYLVERIDTGGFEPDLIDGSQVGESHQLEPDGAPAKLDASIWRSDPATYDYPFERDEAFHVVAGAATVELPDTGETAELRAGDVAYFSAGTQSVWTITEPFVKFVVMPN